MKQYFLYCLALLTLSSCSQLVKQAKKTDLDRRSLQEIIARISEIPDVPFQVHAKNVFMQDENPDNLQVIYECYHWGLKDLKSFYIEEMERLGWSLIVEYQGNDLILVFGKPSGRVCVISARKHIFSLTLTKKIEML